MKQQFTTETLKEAFGFPFQDPKWASKCLLGIFLCILTFPTFFGPTIIMYGYTARIMRRILKGDGKLHLPEWDDWGGLLEDGARFGGLSLVLNSPLILASLVFVGLTFLGMFGAISLVETGQDVDFMPPFILFQMAMICGIMIFSIGSIALGMITPAGVAHAVHQDSFSAGLRFREWWPIWKTNWQGFVLSFVMVMFVSYVVITVGQLLMFTFILACLFPLVMGVMTFYLPLLVNTLFAKAYKAGRQNLDILLPE